MKPPEHCSPFLILSAQENGRKHRFREDKALSRNKVQTWNSGVEKGLLPEGKKKEEANEEVEEAQKGKGETEV